MVSFLPMPAAGNALRGEFFLDIVAIETPCRARAAETLPDSFADAAVLQRAAVVELYLQHPGARIVADGAQLTRVDLFHFHRGVLKTIASLARLTQYIAIIQAYSIEPFQSIMVQSATISRRSMTRSDVGVAQQNRAKPASLSSSGNASTVDLP